QHSTASIIDLVLKKIYIFFFLPLIFLSTSLYAHSEVYNYPNVLLESLRLNHFERFTTSVAGDYLAIFSPKEYQLYQNDEFERPRLIAKAEEDLFAKLEQQKEPQVFSSVIHSRFGEYDFDKKAFDFQPLKNISASRIEASESIYAFPKEIIFSFSNKDIVNGIPMNEDEAKKFLQSRRSLGDGIRDRRVTLELDFKFISATSLSDLVAEIVGFKVLDDKNDVIYQYKGNTK
ncbi:DUF4852 domain-containing protein, partial [Gallibacterium anatis]|uniref:DUF4852 domain-containing protein n=1 Tax=Gallibacterium anatis TaxID=750 RepID=UPI0005311012